MKQHIKEKYKFELEMVPLGCHQRNTAKVAIRNFKSHFLSVLAGTAELFLLHLWDRLLPQTKITPKTFAKIKCDTRDFHICTPVWTF